MRLARLLKQRLSLNTVVRVAAGLVMVFAALLSVAEIVPIRMLQALELQAYDARLRLFMPRTVDPRIVILDIDEKSLAAEGHWPWGRDKLALMLRQLFDRYHARVAAFDIAFPERDTTSGIDTLDRLAATELKDDAQFKSVLEQERARLDYDKVFADEIGRHPVVLGFFLSSKQDRVGVLPPPMIDGNALGRVTEGTFAATVATGYSGNRPELQAQATAAGHLAPGLDFDGVTRRVPMLMRVDDGYYEAMSLALARAYLGNVPASIRTDHVGTGRDAIAWISELRIGDKVIPLDEAMTALVPFRGARGSFRYVSATDVIRGKLEPNELADKAVIVGTSSQGLLDIRQTPVDEDFPGVEVHANMVSGILDQTVKHRPIEAQTISVLLLLLTGIPLAVFLPRLGALAASVVAGGVLAAVVGLNLYAWQALGYVLDFAVPVALVLVLYFFNMVYGFFMEARSRRLITGLFGTYVPKELVDEMSRNPGEYSMRGESREMTVLFSDVRDFTSISEGLAPADLKEMMNAYLTEMTEVIQEKRGTIDKYIGDAIMAFWGAPLADPQHAAHAIEAALAMQKRIRGLDPEFAKRGWPVLNIGVGLNCGEMNVGDMGSRFRRAYTVMGDAVNLASRLEGLTKEYGVGILVSENMVRSAEGFVYREVDRVVVKGRTEGIGIFEPLGRIGEVPEAAIAETERFHKALELYRKRRWTEALVQLESLAARAPSAKLYKVYLERAGKFSERAPEPAWNGTWVFTTK
ncbi:MAG TPA: adenylate/guanylate cyclase domain-containing protein [Usitatibacter sp.]|nr:adenylate/guanylate cyclase domain-containing protein [Usitatibacter sp.]